MYSNNKSVGVYRRRYHDVYLLRKRLSRKPQTITAPPAPSTTIPVFINHYRNQGIM